MTGSCCGTSMSMTPSSASAPPRATPSPGRNGTGTSLNCRMSRLAPALVVTVSWFLDSSRHSSKAVISLQCRGDLPDLITLRPGERQRHNPPATPSGASAAPPPAAVTTSSLPPIAAEDPPLHTQRDCPEIGRFPYTGHDWLLTKIITNGPRCGRCGQQHWRSGAALDVVSEGTMPELVQGRAGGLAEQGGDLLVAEPGPARGAH